MIKIEYLPSFEKGFEKLPKFEQNRIRNEYVRLSLNPFPRNSKKLVKEKDIYRLRVGNYRILYFFDKERKTIYLTHVAHRKDVYR